MGFLDRLLGREERRPAPTSPQGGYRTDPPTSGPSVSQTQRSAPPLSDDERAVERYRYLLRTAPPEQVEQAHAEAFARLTPQQRQQVLTELSGQVPAGERAPSDSPRDLARMATRAEMRQPGTLERSFSRGGLGGGRAGGGLGMGAVIGGSLLAGVAGAFVGTAIADAMFDGFDGDEYAEGFQDGAQADVGDQGADAGYDGAGDDAGYDGGGDDAGYDGGGFDGGGDFGGFDV